MTRVIAAHSLYYQVGVFALVRHKDTYLVVQPHDALLPGAVQLPGVLMSTASGAGLAELGLRRTLLAQVGLSVGSLSLVSSFAVRLPEGDSRLSLIFGSEYVSGILNPTAEVRGADWTQPGQLRGLGAPEWLFAAIREFEAVVGAAPEEGTERVRKPGLMGLLGRKSLPE
ncbi:hypothetical protein [Deinococcus sp.]|uniref:hypothetical protein n=1 Tax=Deinococcus sp. TaxID=47478 RepID=UPI0025CD9C96|nr:hypothetical protein [Deinococcus sp.]